MAHPFTLHAELDDGTEATWFDLPEATFAVIAELIGRQPDITTGSVERGAVHRASDAPTDSFTLHALMGDRSHPYLNDGTEATWFCVPDDALNKIDELIGRGADSLKC